MLTNKNGPEQSKRVLILGIATVLLLIVGCTPPGPAALLDGEEQLNRGKFTAAVRSLEKAANLLPDNPQAFNHLGLAYHKSKDIRKARENYQRAIELNPRLASPHFNLGSLHLEIGNNFEAALELEQYLLVETNDYRGYFKQGEALFRQFMGNGNINTISRAATAYRAALELETKLPAAHNRLGLISLVEGDTVQAYNQFRQALDINETFEQALWNMGVLNEGWRSDIGHAITAYKAYTQLGPDTSRAQQAKVLVKRLEAQLRKTQEQLRLKENEVPEAPPTLSQTNVVDLAATNLVTSPQPEAGTNEVSVASESPQPAPKEEESEKFEPNLDTAQSPVETAKTVDEIETPLTTEEDPEEETEFNPVSPSKEVAQSTPDDDNPIQEPEPTELVALDPEPEPVTNTEENPSTNQTMADIPPYRPIISAVPADNTQESTTVFKSPVPTVQPPVIRTTELVRRNDTATPLPNQTSWTARYNFRYPAKPKPGKPRAAREWGEKAWRAQQAKDYQKAVEFYSNSASLDPANLDVQYNLGYCAEKISDMNTALEAYETAIRIDPKSTRTRYTFSVALDRAGFPMDATHEFERLLFDDPNNVNAHFALAKIYDQKLKHYQSAKKHYQRVLDLDALHPQAIEIQAWINSRP